MYEVKNQVPFIVGKKQRQIYKIQDMSSKRILPCQSQTKY